MQKRTVEQFADGVPMLTLLDSPVPQKVGQLVAVLARFDLPVPEQVIEVSKDFVSTPLLAYSSSLHRGWWKCQCPRLTSARTMGVVQAFVR